MTPRRKEGAIRALGGVTETLEKDIKGGKLISTVTVQLRL
jgi:hypothetical protein